MANFDMESSRMQGLENPFGSKRLRDVIDKGVNHVTGLHLEVAGGPTGT